MEAGHWKRLRATAEARLKANPNDAQAAYWLSNVKQIQNDLDGALALAEKAVALDGRSADFRCQVAEIYGQRAEQAGIFSQFGLARRFKKEAEAAIALDAKHIGCRWSLMEFHMRAPAIVGGNKDKARQLVEEIKRINLARGWQAEARLARLADSKANLEPYYLKAVEADPNLYSARINLADLYASPAHKKYDVAEQHAREALRIDAGRAGAYNFLAGLYAFRERWSELDAILAQAEKNVPDNLNPYYQAGRQLVQAGKDLARAERYLRKYLTQEPEPNAPSLGAAHWRLGQVLEKTGRIAEAKKEYQEAVRLDPRLEEAKKDLKRLR